MSEPPQSSSPVRRLYVPGNIPRSPPQSPFRPNLHSLADSDCLNTVPDDIPRSPPQSPFRPDLNSLTDSDRLNSVPDNIPRSSPQFPLRPNPHSMANSDRLNTVQIFVRGIVWLFILFTGYSAFQYKLESSAIGFCDTGSNTSRTLRELLAKRLAIDECIGETAAHKSSEVEQSTISDLCPLRPLVSLPHPKSCTPCPEHASCAQFDVFCDSGYLIKPNILLSFIPVKPSSSELSTKHASYLAELFFHAVSAVTDGLPGFGSVGLPPRCAEDPQRRRNIGSLGKAIESTLAKERGRRVCLGNNFNDKISQDAVRWGVEVENLREVFRKKTTVYLVTFFLACLTSHYRLSLPSYLCSMICLTRRFAS